MNGQVTGPDGDVLTAPIVVSGLASDAHTWNLIFIQLVVEELGHTVINLGPCMPDAELVAEADRLCPALVVFSTVNGHGYADARRVIRTLRRSPALVDTLVVIGGKLSVHGTAGAAQADELLQAGFDAVFGEGKLELDRFRTFVAKAAGEATRCGHVDGTPDRPRVAQPAGR